MADEAVVRIILQDDGSSAGAAAPSPHPTPTTPTQGSPSPPPPQPQGGTRPLPPYSPSPPPAGTPRPPTQSTTTPQSAQQPQSQQQQSTTTTQSRPRWVDDLIAGVAKSVKDLAVQLTSGRLTPPTTAATAHAGGVPQIIQSLQTAQTSLPQFQTSVMPPGFGSPTYQPPSPALPYSPPAPPAGGGSGQVASILSPPPPPAPSATVDVSDEVVAKFQRDSARSKKGWITKKAQAEEARLAQEKKDAKNARRRAKYAADKAAAQAAAATEATVDVSGPGNATSDLDVLGFGKMVNEVPLSPPESSPPPELPRVTKPTFVSGPPEGEGPPRFASGGFLSKIFGLGQKEQPAQSAEVDISHKSGSRSERYKTAAPINYDPATFQKNNQLIDSLRDALLKAGYTAKDAANIAGDKDVLDVWKMNAPHASAAEALANLRKSGVLRYGPYDAPHFMRGLEAHKKQQEILLGKSLEELTPEALPDITLSVPEAPAPPLSGVKYDKRGRIITSRKGKRPPAAESATAGDAENTLPLTRKRPRRIFGVGQESSDLPDLPSNIFGAAEGGELPRFARGGKYLVAKPYYPTAQPYAPPPDPVVYAQRAEVPVGRPVAPQLSDYKKKLLGAEANVEFRDPYFDTSNKELLEAYRRNQAVPIPKDSDVSQDVANMWRDVSRLMPDAARAVTRISEFTPEELEYFASKGSYPRGAFDPNTGVLRVNPETANVGTLWHELVHAEQLISGRLRKEPIYEDVDSAEGGLYSRLTKHGRLMESEAHQRALQSGDILDRLRSEIQKDNKPQQASIPARATGGDAAPAAIVGDLPGQSIDAIKSDPHTEVIVGNQVVPHHEALRHGLFDGKPPKFARGGQLPRYARGGGFLGRMARRMFGPKKAVPYKPGRKFVPGKPGVAGVPATPTSPAIPFQPPQLPIAGTPPVAGIPATAGAGPIGEIYQAALAAGKMVEGANRAVIGGASGVANWAASADTDPSKTIYAMGDAAAKAGDALSSVIPGAGILTSALGEAGKALGSFMAEMNKTVERYGEVSPAIAQQQAIGEIRQVMGDMRRAREGESEIIRYMQAQQDMQQKFEDMKMKILTKILPLISNIMEVIDKLIPEGNGIANVVAMLLVPLNILAEAANFIAGTQRDNQLPQVQDPAAVLLSTQRGTTVGDQNNFTIRDR